MSVPAIIIAAPTSGAGKTVISLGIMAALKARGLRVRAAKSGPDYIDPAFHQVATGAPSVNLDAWAMTKSDLRARAIAQGGDILVIEAAMGVLDGGADGAGSAADLAEALGCPMIMVLDIAKVGHSATLPALGLTVARPDIPLAGVIFNRAGSDRHISLAKANLGKLPFFGAVRRNPDLVLAERHLGLVQACEHLETDEFLKNASAMY